VANYAPRRATYDTGDRRWLPNMLKAETHGVTVVLADVTADGTGLVKSGSLVAGEGLVLNDFVIKTGEKHHIAVVHAGSVDRRFLPAPLTSAAEASFPAVVFNYGTAPAA